MFENTLFTFFSDSKQKHDFYVFFEMIYKIVVKSV